MLLVCKCCILGNFVRLKTQTFMSVFSASMQLHFVKCEVKLSIIFCIFILYTRRYHTDKPFSGKVDRSRANCYCTGSWSYALSSDWCCALLLLTCIFFYYVRDSGYTTLVIITTTWMCHVSKLVFVVSVVNGIQ